MNSISVDLLRLIFILVLIVSPAIVKVLKKANEAKQKQAQEAKRKAAEYEFIRTGRATIESSDGSRTEIAIAPSSSSRPTTTQVIFQTPSASTIPPHQDAKQRLQEMARQRRAQLQAQTQVQAQIQARPRPASSLSQSSSTLQRQILAQQQQAVLERARTQEAQAQRQAQIQRKAQQRSKAAKSRPTSSSAASTSIPSPIRVADKHEHTYEQENAGESVVHRLVSDTPTTEPLQSSLQGLRVRTAGGQIDVDTIADLRRAIVLREVLAAPLAIRELEHYEERESLVG